MLVKHNDLSEDLTLQNLLKECWPGQFFYCMKLGLNASMFCQICLAAGYTRGTLEPQVHLNIIRE